MKNRKPFRNEKSYREPAAVPDVVNMDDLAVMTDDVLLDRLRSLEASKERMESRADAKPWEVEVAYVRRELNQRRQRHQLHDDYLHNLDLEAAELAAIENSYPVADLDNSAFLFFN